MVVWRFICETWTPIALDFEWFQFPVTALREIFLLRKLNRKRASNIIQLVDVATEDGELPAIGLFLAAFLEALLHAGTRLLFLCNAYTVMPV